MRGEVERRTTELVEQYEACPVHPQHLKGVDMAIARGEVDGAIITEPMADTGARPPECREVRLRIFPLQNATVGFGVAASRSAPGAVTAADEIREEIEIGRAHV